MSQIFLTAAANEVLKDIISHLPLKPSQYKVAFINTAAETYTEEHWWVNADKQSLIDLGFIVDEFTITGLTVDQISQKIDGKQIIFIAGGNTFYLLDQIIKTGFEPILRQKIKDGTIYIGSSAGSMIVGRRIDLVSTIDDASKAPYLKSNGLEIVDYAFLPHWGQQPFIEEYRAGFDSMFTEGVKIIPLTNKQYLWFDNDKLNFINVK